MTDGSPLAAGTFRYDVAAKAQLLKKRLGAVVVIEFLGVVNVAGCDSGRAGDREVKKTDCGHTSLKPACAKLSSRQNSPLYLRTPPDVAVSYKGSDVGANFVGLLSSVKRQVSRCRQEWVFLVGLACPVPPSLTAKEASI